MPRMPSNTQRSDRMSSHFPWPLCRLSLIGVCLLMGRVSGGELGPPQDVVFRSQHDGTEQRYVVQVPEGFLTSSPRGVLIALHGHGSDRWQFVQQMRDECRAARDTAAAFNLLYVSPDYRAKTSWMGPAATADLQQILADLRSQYQIEQVIVSGGSMGGTSALMFAVLHPEQVHGVVSLNGTANITEFRGFPEAIAESYGGTREAVPEIYRQRTAEFFPEKLTMPVAMTTGGRDTIVPPESCQRLAKVLEQQSRPVRLIHQPEGGHDTNYADSLQAYASVVKRVRGE